MAAKKKITKKKAKKKAKKTAIKKAAPKQSVEVKPVGRPSRYTKALGVEICKRLMKGESLGSISDDSSMPHKSTVLRWLLANFVKKNDEGIPTARATYPEFRDAYYNARKIQYAGLADEMIDIADESKNDYMTRKNAQGEEYEVVNPEAMARTKLRLDTRFKLLSKVDPERWGDKVVMKNEGTVEHNHSGTIEHKAADMMNFEQVRDQRAKLKVVN